MNSITANLEGLIDLTWNDVEGAISYNIYRANTPIHTISSINPVDTTVQTFFVDNVTEPGYYYYAITAVNVNGESDLSNNKFVKYIPSNLTDTITETETKTQSSTITETQTETNTNKETETVIETEETTLFDTNSETITENITQTEDPSLSILLIPFLTSLVILPLILRRLSNR